MSHRPLVFVSGLTLCDYLLWNWSLNSNHDVLALVSGLTLPPLGVACVWLLALSMMRVLARQGRRDGRTRALGSAMGRSGAGPDDVGAALEEPHAASTATGASSSGKLAA